MFWFLSFIFKIISLGFFYICLFALQIMAPLGIQIIMVFINLFVADPIPYVDEIIQIIILFGSLSKK